MTQEQTNPERKERFTINKLSWEEKAELCKRWKESGIKKRVFCKQHGLALATFCGWCNQVWPRINKLSNSQLAPVRIVNNSNKTEENDQIELELSLPNQTMARMRLPLSSIGRVIQELCHAVTIIR